jgi:hypothetical protein
MPEISRHDLIFALVSAGDRRQLAGVDPRPGNHIRLNANGANLVTVDLAESRYRGVTRSPDDSLHRAT